MSKTLLHRLFGFGKVPKDALAALEAEGIVLLDEGIRGSITFKNFRAPGRRYHRRRNRFTGSLVMTGTRFVAFIHSKPIINVPLADPHLKELHCSLDATDTLRVAFEAAAFHEKWSGSVECRFATAQAREFLERLEQAGCSQADRR
jgi:hypothetical protein